MTEEFNDEEYVYEEDDVEEGHIVENPTLAHADSDYGASKIGVHVEGIYTIYNREEIPSVMASRVLKVGEVTGLSDTENR
jgi:hypothetical protein